ncbi:MAG: hypothetical protein IT393_00120 [Nitrospirae bacterium]|nr:hypothetical protein [Nitrospirota bacterium]
MTKHLFFSNVIITTLAIVMPTFVNGAEFIQGVVQLGGQLRDGTAVKIDMRTVKLTPQYPYAHAFMWGGDFESRSEVIMPKNVIAAINIQIGNEKMFVPLSAYSDLGNPYQASFEKTDRGFRLIIAGRGGTSTPYKAVLEFNNENIQRRRITLDIFPDEVWEETEYSFKSSTDEK